MDLEQIAETFLPKLDGIVNTLCHLLHYLDAEGHESILFAPEGGIYMAYSHIDSLPYTML